MAYTFGIYRDKAKQFRVRLRAPNGEIMFSTEGYVAKTSAKHVIRSIIKNVGKAVIDDQSDLRKKVAAPKKVAKKRKGAKKRKAAKKR